MLAWSMWSSVGYARVVVFLGNRKWRNINVNTQMVMIIKHKVETEIHYQCMNIASHQLLAEIS